MKIQGYVVAATFLAALTSLRMNRASTKPRLPRPPRTIRLRPC